MTEIALEQMKANRKLWVEALRSGRYAQDRLWLKSENGYCCLGVLAEVAGAEWTYDGAGAFYAEGDRTVSLAPAFAMEFVGLCDLFGSYEGTSLALLNDAGLGFPEIADIIEAEPEGLFIESVQL